MSNTRNAGRKPMISQKDFNELKIRIESGEKVASLADEYGISRQAIYQRLKKENDHCEIEISCLDGAFHISTIHVDQESQTVRIQNYTNMLSKTPFGWNTKPEWEEYEEYLERKYLEKKMPGPRFYRYPDLLCEDVSYSTVPLSRLHDGRTFRIWPANTTATFSFHRKDLLYTRSDTDGFQMKALSHDRKWLVKAQAVMAGKKMDDWMVEVIASDICSQLMIPHVEQLPCSLFYNGQPYMGVYSRNFELDGFTFISFERLLERMGKSSSGKEFVHLTSTEKLRWCAEKLSEAGSIPKERTLKYMLDLAIVDCLVGNTDRHTRNFGLFYSARDGCYDIPLIFDCGMGLFEHDYYRDEYNDFGEAMRTVYVEPYGEDPFDFLRILIRDFDILARYPNIQDISYMDYPVSALAKEYQKRIKALLLTQGFSKMEG